MFFIAREVRELTISVNPVRTTVIKAGQSSQFNVTYRGMELSNDVNAVQIALWNAGKRPIKRDEILAPIWVSMTNVQVLEATVRSTSRDVTQFTLDSSNMQLGMIGISWRILEKSDGGSIQIIYAGSPTAPISFQGIIQEQSHLNVVTTPSDKLSKNSFRLMMLLIGSFILFPLWMAVRFWGAVERRGISVHYRKEAIVIFGCSGCLAICLAFLVWYQLRGPPFAF